MRRFLDLLAVLLLLGYAYLAWSASTPTPAGPPLDPVLAAAQARGTLRVATDVGFRPFTDQLADGQLTGYDIELAAALGAKLGLRVEFVPTGYDALYDALTSGRADLVASALPYAPEQGYRARFSSFYFDAGQMLLAPAAGALQSADDLAGLRVGVALGSDADALARRLARSTPGLDLRSTYDEPAQVIADLRAGTLDAAIVDHIVALAAVQTDPSLTIVEALTFEPYVLAMPTRAFQLQIEVNRALDELRAEGFLTELNGRWMR
jgi:ABC-type amino acid transport substrate-binding protein